MQRKHHYLVLPPEVVEDRYVAIGPEPIVVGRNPSCRITIADSAVSGTHCRIVREGEKVVVEDLGSTNGTFLDDRRVAGRVEMPVGAILTVGRNLLRHELLDAEEIRRRQMVSLELQRATAYVRSLLPAPVAEGPVRAEWRFIPSATLGGDAFGYHWMDRDRFCFYLLDVCGHGAASALHSVAVVHALRRRSMTEVDFTKPDQVLAALNRSFPMEEHGRLFLTVWYGIYDRATRQLVYAGAGHPPALLVPPEGLPIRLESAGLPVGMLPEGKYESQTVEVPPGSRLHLYSDGTFEVRTRTGEYLDLAEFHRILAEPPEAGVGAAERIERTVRARMAEHDFPDDFSLLVLHFE